MSLAARCNWLKRKALAVLALGYLACAPTEPQAVELLPLPPLDLSGVDEATADSLQQRHDFVVRLQSGENPRPQGLAWAFGQLGKAYLAYLDFEPARACLANAHRLEPEEFRWPYLLGYLERIEGDFAASRAHFEAVLELRPDHYPTFAWLAENALDQQDLVAAEARFQRVLELQPEHVKARAGLGRIALERKEYARALDHLEAARTLQLQATEIHYALALAHRGLGQQERARSYFNRVPAKDDARIPIEPDDPLIQEISDLRQGSQTFVRFGRRALARGLLPAALGYFEQALEVDPDRADARYNLAATQLRLGRRPAARATLGELIDRSPDYVQARVLIARMLISENAFEVAEEHLRIALTLDPEAERAHLVLGDLLRLQGRLDAALASYRDARALVPDLDSASFGVAAALLLQERYEAAATELEQGLSSLPESRLLELLLARLLATAPRPDLRDGERALELARSAVRGRETVADAETLAMAFAELGRFDEALLWQRSAVERIETAERDSALARTRLARYQRRLPCREPWSAGERLTAFRVQPIMNR
ncbi:MAG: tetratricopeptide repeat protein [Acidobacteriota bacterium]